MKRIKNIISTLWGITWIRAMLITELIILAALSIYRCGYITALHERGINTENVMQVHDR